MGENVVFDDSLLSTGDIDFSTLVEEAEETQDKENPEKQEKNNESSTEDDDNLFDNQNPESVGEKNNTEGGESSSEGGGNSPKVNIYSSFAKALKDDALLQFVSQEDVDNVDSADKFSEIFENEVKGRLTQVQKEIYEALEAGVPTDTIRQYNNIIKNLEDITEEQLKAEGDEGTKLRQNLIYWDYVNKGFSEERAKKKVQQSFNSGTDLEDAQDALESNKQFFKEQYENIVNKAKEEEKKEQDRIKKQTDDFKKALLEKETIFKDITLDMRTRQKAFEVMTKPVFTNEAGERLTEVQKYADEHPVEFRTALGVLYTLTDGFSDMGKLLQKSVNKKVKSNLQELEKKINNSTATGGGLSFMGGSSEGDDTYNYLRGLKVAF